MDVIDACRTCLQYDDYMSSIYKPIPLESGSQPITPIELFRMIPRLNIIESDRLPSNICSKCLDDTLYIYTFILKCERANRMLNQEAIDIKLEPVKTNGVSSNHKGTTALSDFYSPRPSKSVECIPCFDLTSDSASECDFEVTPDIQEIDEPFQTGPSSPRKIRTIIIGDQPEIKIENIDDDMEDIKPNVNEITFANQIQSSSMKNTFESLMPEIKKEELEIGEETIYAPNFMNEKDIKQEADVHNELLQQATVSTQQQHNELQQVTLNTQQQHNQLQQVTLSNVITVVIPPFTHFAHFMNQTQPKVKSRKSKASDSIVSKCNDCGREFKTARELEQHMEQCLPLFECGICSEAFQDNDSVAVHFVTVHPGEKPIFNKTDVKPLDGAENADGMIEVISECSFQCPECPKSFATERRLEGHLKVHSQRHVCVPCNKSFRTKHHLKCHLVRKHQDTWKRIICGVCDLRFACKADLLRHQLKHTKEKPYKCSECPNTYGYKKVLADHIRQNHNLTESEIQQYLKENYSKALVKYLSNEFTCYVCAAVVVRDDLAAHMNSHKKMI